MQIQPPPRIVDKFEKIWRDWLYYLWDFIQKHTGGSTPVSPATGTNWNAHGNVAVGDGTSTPASGGRENYMSVEDASFWIKTTSGGFPTDLDNSTKGLVYVGVRGAFRSGGLDPGVGWWSLGAFGDYSFGAGYNAYAPAEAGVAIGYDARTISAYEVAIGYDVNVSWFDATGLSSAIGLGRAMNISGKNSAGVGFNCSTSGEGSLAVGGSVTASQFRSIGVGVFATSSNTDSIALGSFINATGAAGITIGSGYDDSNRLNNTTANAMWMGVASTAPTFIMKKQGAGIADSANIGIIEQDPLSTLDVGGNVGYKFSVITANKTIGSSDAELTLICDLTAGNNITLTLPAISTCDRRIYHIKTFVTTAGAPGSLTLTPNAVDGIEGAGVSNGRMGADGVSRTTGLPLGTNLMLQAVSNLGGWIVL